MRTRFNSHLSTISVFLLFAITISACTITINTGQKSAPTVMNMPTAITVSAGKQPHQKQAALVANPTLNPNTPGEPTAVEGQVTDPDSSKYASEKRVVTGDSYKSNFFERPFTATTMDYLPDVDIINGYISSDVNYFYFTIELVGTNKDTGGMQASYGVELDTDKDGRGNYSIWALNPSGTAWTTNNVTVLKDGNHDVGGTDVYSADLNPSLSNSNGYETVIPNNGAEAAWARINPTVSNIVQIAVHRNLIGNPSQFLWGVWADNGPKNPNLFDYDDHFTYQDAGSPISGNQYYPLKQVAAVDNTCRRTYGFSVSYRIPNMCWSGGPVATPVPGELKFICLTCLLQIAPHCGCPPAPGCPPC